ncbi:MAG: hypothetical protein RI637_06175, partial [Acidimicrobiia bacterium]|nr:hypothetical protein [Acidimicrobiia bacterium]
KAVCEPVEQFDPELREFAEHLQHTADQGPSAVGIAAPQVGRIVVNTKRIEDIQPLMDWVRAEAAERWPGVQIVARRLSQGPPAPAPGGSM